MDFQIVGGNQGDFAGGKKRLAYHACEHRQEQYEDTHRLRRPTEAGLALEPYHLNTGAAHPLHGCIEIAELETLTTPGHSFQAAEHITAEGFCTRGRERNA